jgi:hypothetical protein
MFPKNSYDAMRFSYMKRPFVLPFLFVSLIVTAIYSRAEVIQIPSRPLTNACEPISTVDKIRMRFDRQAFWSSKNRELQSYRNGVLTFLRVAPLELERELRDLQLEMRKDRLLVPELYQGDLGPITQKLEAESLIATREMWVTLIQQARQDVAWADKCLKLVGSGREG